MATATVDLRPMSLGELLDRTFSLYKQHFWLFIGVTALPFVFLLLLQLAGNAFQGEQLGAMQTGQISPSLMGGAIAGASVIVIVYILMACAAQAATIFAVSDVYLGNEATVKGSFAQVGTKLLRILGIFLVIFCMAVGAAIVAGICFAILVRAPALLFLMFLAGFVVAIYFFCRIAVAVPVAMLEDAGPTKAIGRSFELTKGFAGQIFLICLLVGIIAIVGSIILNVLFLGGAFSAVREHRQVPMGTTILYQIFAFGEQVLIGPIGTIAISLMYYNLRVRKEAFDVQHLMASMGEAPSPGARPLA